MEFCIENPCGEFPDSELVRLLTDAYVGGGFTSPERAATIFEPSAVRNQGRLICARAIADGALVGMVIVVLPDAPARRLAEHDEAELQLLAVDPKCHGRGIGQALLAAAFESIHAHGFRTTVLWTQPGMIAAQRLYEKMGFIRIADRDPTFSDIDFLAYQIQH